jgi:hypothetical protein
VVTQLGRDRLTVSVPDAHVESLGHRALRNKNGEIPDASTIYRETSDSKPNAARRAGWLIDSLFLHM